MDIERASNYLQRLRQGITAELQDIDARVEFKVARWRRECGGENG